MRNCDAVSARMANSASRSILRNGPSATAWRPYLRPPLLPDRPVPICSNGQARTATLPAPAFAHPQPRRSDPRRVCQGGYRPDAGGARCAWCGTRCGRVIGRVSENSRVRRSDWFSYRTSCSRTTTVANLPVFALRRMQLHLSSSTNKNAENGIATPDARTKCPLVCLLKMHCRRSGIRIENHFRREG